MDYIDKFFAWLFGMKLVPEPKQLCKTWQESVQEELFVQNLTHGHKPENPDAELPDEEVTTKIEESEIFIAAVKAKKKSTPKKKSNVVSLKTEKKKKK